MNALSSSTPVLLLNPNSQGLFSSKTAFQRPKLSNSLKNTTLISSKVPLDNSVRNQTKRAYKPIQITIKSEDPDLIICEPVKKIKSVQEQEEALNLLRSNKNKEIQPRPSKLTVEMVFDGSVKAKNPQPNTFFDDDDEANEEDSNLSFISSSSLDNLEVLDEEVTQVNKEKDLNKPQNTIPEAILQPLFVRDNFATRINYLNSGNYFTPALMRYPVMFPHPQYNFTTINPNQYIQSNSNSYQPLQNLMSYTPINTTEFLSNLNSSYLIQEKDLSNRMNEQFENIRAKVSQREDDGYDSDSYATRSTGIEHNQDGTDKSQKSASPIYSVGEEINTDEKIHLVSLEESKKKKRGRKPKHSSQEGTDCNLKVKKGRSLNLQIDINPKHLKIERRLNKLQRLRYQQEGGVGEEEDLLNKLGGFVPLSRNNSIFNENNDSPLISSNEAKINIMEPQLVVDLQAEIPPLSLGPSRRRPNMSTVWNPEGVNQEELENFLEQLGQIVEFPVTDQQLAIKILKSHNMNAILALEAVKENKEMYSEMLKIKVKRVRRRGA